MKLTVLLISLLPLLSIAQSRRSMAARRAFDQGFEQYQTGNLDASLASFNTAIAEDSTFTEAYLNKSYIQLEQKKYSDAMASVLNALDYNKFQAAIYVQAGVCAYYLEQYENCIEYLKQGISYGAKAESDYLFMARSLMNTGEYREAVVYFTKAIELNSASESSYLERGAAYFKVGDYELAKADFEKVLSINPQSEQGLTNMANVLLALGDNETAITYIDKAILDSDGDQKVQLLIMKGNYYRNIGDFENASLAYNEAYALDQQNAVILNNQAALLIKMNDFEGAFEKCNQAIELQPEMMEAYFNRGIANEMLRNVEAACLDWEQAFILGSSIAEEYLNSPVCTE